MKYGLLWLAVIASPAAAEDGVAVLSGSFGRPMTVGQMQDAREAWVAAAADVGQLVAAFKAVCHDGASPPAGFERGEITLPVEGKAGAATVPVLQAPGIQVSMWDGDPLTLKGRASVIRDRGVVVTGPVTNRNIRPGQCSLSAKTSGITGEGLGQAMTQAFGTSTKLVVKPAFADGEWQIERSDGSKDALAFYAVDLNKAEQLLHISLISERAVK